MTETTAPRRRLRKTKTERKTEVRDALARNEPASAAPAEADQLWANRINEADKLMQTTMADMVNVIISLGKTLLAAKDELGHGNFKAMVERKTRFKLRTAELYMQIASNAFLSNPQHVATLPPYVSTLGVLASWKPAALEVAVTKGDVTPELDRAKANELSKEYGPPKAITARPTAPPPSAPSQTPTPQRRGAGVSAATKEQAHPDPDQNNGFTPMPDGSGQVRLRTPEWRHELGAGVIVYEDQDDDITDLAMQLTVLIGRVRDLPMSKSRPLLQPLESGLIELLGLLGYDIDRADPPPSERQAATCR